MTPGTASAPAWLASARFPTLVPAEVKAAALAIKDAQANGTYHAFTGPINKQDGSAWLAEGETADDGTLAGMNFYVEGLEGDIPQ